MCAALEKYKPRKLKLNYFHSKPGLLKGAVTYCLAESVSPTVSASFNLILSSCHILYINLTLNGWKKNR